MEPNLKYLTDIYETCKKLEIVTSQTEFSELCGRTPSWFSVCKSRNLKPSTEALVKLSLNLSANDNLPNPQLKNLLNQNVCMLLSHRIMMEHQHAD